MLARPTRPCCRAAPYAAALLCTSAGRRPPRGRHDPTARRPTSVCDPYENNGKPLSQEQCAQLLPSVSDSWALVDDGTALMREIEVADFVQGSRLVSTLAAVAFNNNHYPVLTLERRLSERRRWQELVVVRCQTTVLGGLSYQDFTLAMLMDVELGRSSEREW